MRITLLRSMVLLLLSASITVVTAKPMVDPVYTPACRFGVALRQSVSQPASGRPLGMDGTGARQTFWMIGGEVDLDQVRACADRVARTLQHAAYRLLRALDGVPSRIIERGHARLFRQRHHTPPCPHGGGVIDAAGASWSDNHRQPPCLV